MNATLGNLGWLLGYLVVVGAIVVCLFWFRDWSHQQLGSRAAQTAWQQWKAETRRQEAGSGPVLRREAMSDEPPALVLTRDRFGVVLTAALVLASVLYATLMFMVRGVLRGNSRQPLPASIKTPSHESRSPPHDTPPHDSQIDQVAQDHERGE